LSPAQKAAIKAVQADDKGMTALDADVDGLALGDPAGVPDVQAPDGTPKERPFLNWLWEHRQEILAFVIKIAGMFGLGVPGLARSAKKASAIKASKIRTTPKKATKRTAMKAAQSFGGSTNLVPPGSRPFDF
jgi:hypothetical protein